MDAFEAPGLFWLAGGDAKPVPGRLVFEPARGARVELLGQLMPVRPGVGLLSRDRPMIHGEVLSAPPELGPCVTLVRALMTRSASGSGLAVEHWIADRVYIGTGPLQDADQSATSAHMVIANLELWLGSSGLNFERGREGFSASYEPVTPVRVLLADASITIDQRGTGGYAPNRIELVEEAEVAIEPIATVTMREIDQRWIVPFRWFLALCFGRPATTKWLRYRLTSDDHVQLLGNPQTQSPSTFDPFEALLRPSLEDLPSLISRFFDVAERRAGFLRLFFPLLEHPPRFVEMRLLIALEALSMWASGDQRRGLIWLAEAESTALCLPPSEPATRWVAQLEERRERLVDVPQPEHPWRVSVDVHRIEWALRLALISEMGESLEVVREHPSLVWLRGLEIATG